MQSGGRAPADRPSRAESPLRPFSLVVASCPPPCPGHDAEKCERFSDDIMLRVSDFAAESRGGQGRRWAQSRSSLV
ncbi:hypothetical protein GFL86_18905 [Rhizobium laguerreae]|nr:hypothetical protein [Rhizobium laguerreae]